jgi:hypothetical protein
MKKNLFYLFFLLTLTGRSQNLVPNPDFEIYTSCPAGPDEVYKATGWISYRNSPDYFHSCATIPQFSVPSNQLGYQQALSGNAYCGFIAFNHSSFYREIIGRQLSTSLTMGQKYFVSFEVALDNNWGQCATDKLGAKFSTTPFSFSNPTPINNSAHIYTSTIMTDTLNWTNVSGSFIADSAYDYIMVGNFFDDFNTDTTQIWGYQYCTSYYFIENVCVSTDSLTCNPDKGALIHEYDNNLSIKIFPNPASEYIIIESSVAIKANEIKLYNLYSHLIEFSYQILDNSKCLLKFNNLLYGIYVLSITNDHKKHLTRKIIIHN